MQLEDLILVSVDDHVVEPPSLSDFFDGPLSRRSTRTASPRVIRRDDGTDVVAHRRPGDRDLRAQRRAGPSAARTGAWIPRSFDQVRPGTYDVHERIRDMNVNGVLGVDQLPVVARPRWPVLRAERRQRVRRRA